MNRLLAAALLAIVATGCLLSTERPCHSSSECPSCQICRDGTCSAQPSCVPDSGSVTPSLDGGIPCVETCASGELCDMTSGQCSCTASSCPLSQVCSQAHRCECPAGQIRCGELCAVSASDPNHCGKCDRICGSDELCSGGSCLKQSGGLVIVKALQLDKTLVHPGETIHGSVTYKNNSSVAYSVAQVVIAARPPGGTHAGGPYLDFQPHVAETTIQPGKTVQVQASRTFSDSDAVGTWEVYPTFADSDWTPHDGPSQFVQRVASADAGIPDAAIPADAAVPADAATPIAATPTFDPPPGTYPSTQSVTLACASPSPTIRYTVDGTTPNGTSTVYTSPVSISVATTLRALCQSQGLVDSVTASGVYVIGTGPARYLGINLPWTATNVEVMYADLAKNSRPWTDANDNLVQLDANGWPTTAARIGLIEGGVPSYYAASGYKLRFNGPQSGGKIPVTPGGGTINLSNPSYSNGVWTADVTITRVDNAWLDFSAAVQNVSLTLPGHLHGTDFWNKDFLAAIAPFSVLRTMQSGGPGMDHCGTPWCGNSSGVMGSRDTHWATRHSLPNKVGYTYNGMPWEDMVILANLTGKDVWINIPRNVDADYITRVAQLFRYGSDGKNPFAQDTHDPLTWDPSITSWYPALAPGRRVYVEFDNEIWNYSGSGTAQANAEIAAGDPHHLGSGGGDAWVAWKVVQASLLWRQVWGDAAMQDRVRIVLANQGDWGGWDRHRGMLSYVDRIWGPTSTYAAPFAGGNPVNDGLPSGFTNPKKPVSYYVHNISGSFYIHWSSPGDLNTAFDQLNTSLSVNGGLKAAGENNCVYERIGYGQSMAQSYGIQFSGYEGGIETTPASGGISAQADADSRMQALLEGEMHRFYQQSRGDVFVYFWLMGGANVDASLSPDLRTRDTYRWKAIQTIASGH